MEKNKNRRLWEHRPKAVLRVQGEDSAIFLQGQFTNDLKIEIGKMSYGLWLTQKGKVLADSHVLRVAAADFLLISAQSAAAVIAERLEQYIIADDVMVTDETERYSALTIWPDEREGLAVVVGQLPEPGSFAVHQHGMIFSEHSERETAWIWVGPTIEGAQFSSALQQAGFQPVDFAAAERKRIEEGILSVPRDIGPTDLPNEGGLETVAISYTKGCYLGQEVMARLKNLGQVRRQLRVLRGRGSPPDYLAPLYQGSVKVGEIRTSVADGGDFLAWAMMSLVTFNPALGCAHAPDASPSLAIVSHG